MAHPRLAAETFLLNPAADVLQNSLILLVKFVPRPLLQPALLGKFQEVLQGLHSLGLGPPQIDPVRRHGGEDDHLRPGPGHRHIQPLPAAGFVQRAKIQGELSLRVRPVGHGKQDRIPLVPLYIFQVLDKQRFLPRVGPPVKLRVLLIFFLEQILDECLLAEVKCDHADGLAPPLRILVPPFDLPDDGPRLALVHPALPALEKAVRLHQPHFLLPVVDGGEGQHGILIKFPVAERNQTLMPAAVMPVQMGLRHPQSQAVV